jgi:hypothetical protein
MLLSAELRLFWFDHKPAELENWFLDAAIHQLDAWGPEIRTDVYLPDSQIELGVKTRGQNAGVEVKGLIAKPGDTLEFASYQIPIEFWCKWPSQKLAFDTQTGVTMHKQRWLRKFNTATARPSEARESMPEIGCNVEWTIVTLSGAICWTFGFEAFGHRNDVEKSLRSVARVMSGRNPPNSPGAAILSYPAFIAQAFTR